MTATEELNVAGLNVSRETLTALHSFEALVQRWTSVINLVSKQSLPYVWSRHILDSAQIFSVCPQNARSWVDLGSGGGFPGIVVAILAKEMKPDMNVTLVESDLRKATFLRQAVQALNLPANVVSQRIEAVEPLRADVLSARALASLSDLLAFAVRHLHPDGVAVFPKGAKFAEEIAEARTTWAFDVDTRPSLSEAEAAILVIRNINRAHN
ncbi:MAG: 16S rRNA (guanine(527)-N(7))-methyltransferase RsmG [Tabrizicola sp.]|jgi:16S rRNA (guanine527-N7)-methyltransferase|nr:16S rRNA (guanine(527)-N(7))-methyltransferase RsmG [Tabrizicola sp.]